EHAVALGRDGRERDRVVVADRAVGAEVRITVAAPGIEVGVPVTGLAHAATGIVRARQAAWRQARLDREAHVVQVLLPTHQAAHEGEVGGAVRVVAVEAVTRLPAADPIGSLGGMSVDVIVARPAERNRAVALADVAWPAVPMAGDAVERGSVSARERVG